MSRRSQRFAKRATKYDKAWSDGQSEAVVLCQKCTMVKYQEWKLGRLGARGSVHASLWLERPLAKV